MDSGRFDALARTIPGGARRGAVRLLAAVPAVGLLASLLGADEAAQAGKKRRGRRGPVGPAGPAGPVGTITKRKTSLVSITAGATVRFFPGVNLARPRSR